MKTLTRIALALTTLLTLAGCAPALHGAGNVEQWRADLRTCNLETLGFGFIPDFGVTKDFHLRKCMKERSWVKTVDLTGWAWTGVGSTLQLYRFPNGDRQMVFVCPSRKTPCETVRASEAPADIETWTFRAWPGEVSRQLDVFIVGDQDACEVVRQRDAGQSIAVTPACEGPRYFERVTHQEATK
jgi:hypothetical protein